MNNRKEGLYPFEENFLTPSASSGEMTGLIPGGITETEQIDAYNEVYPYLAENFSVPNGRIEQKIKKK